jgi:hypothetical protein
MGCTAASCICISVLIVLDDVLRFYVTIMLSWVCLGCPVLRHGKRGVWGPISSHSNYIDGD